MPTSRTTPPAPFVLAILLFATGIGVLLGGHSALAQNETGPATPLPTIRSITPEASPAIVLRNKTSVLIQGVKIDADVSIDISGCQDVTIISCDLRSIRVADTARLRIVNSYLHDSPHNAVDLHQCRDVLIQGNRIERVASGVYAHRSTGVQVVGNYVRDVQGPMPRGQLAQFDQVTGPGNRIAHNHAINHHGRSTPEDVINLHQSHGTADSPILIEHNVLVGDPERGSQDMSDSGSGVMLGDGGGSHQRCVHNTLLNPGQVGIGVAGGGDITVSRNTVFGTRSNVSNVGVYVWNQYKKQPAGPISVNHNRVWWINAEDNPNPFWNGGGFPRITEHANTFGDETLDAENLLPDSGFADPVPPMPFGETAEYPFVLPGE